MHQFTRAINLVRRLQRISKPSDELFIFFLKFTHNPCALSKISTASAFMAAVMIRLKTFWGHTFLLLEL